MMSIMTRWAEPFNIERFGIVFMMSKGFFITTGLAWFSDKFSYFYRVVNFSVRGSLNFIVRPFLGRVPRISLLPGFVSCQNLISVFEVVLSFLIFIFSSVFLIKLSEFFNSFFSIFPIVFSHLKNQSVPIFMVI